MALTNTTDVNFINRIYKSRLTRDDLSAWHRSANRMRILTLDFDCRGGSFESVGPGIPKSGSKIHVRFTLQERRADELLRVNHS